MDKKDIRQKIDWEGWPNAIEWIDPQDIEDPTIRELFYRAEEHYFALDAIEDELGPLLGDDEDDS